MIDGGKQNNFEQNIFFFFPPVAKACISAKQHPGAQQYNNTETASGKLQKFKDGVFGDPIIANASHPARLCSDVSAKLFGKKLLNFQAAKRALIT